MRRASHCTFLARYAACGAIVLAAGCTAARSAGVSAIDGGSGGAALGTGDTGRMDANGGQRRQKMTLPYCDNP